ncbi:MAG: TlpA family protein disulfide reductase [Anaplasma sp.]
MKRSRMGKIAIGATFFTVFAVFLLYGATVVGGGGVGGVANKKGFPKAFIRETLQEDMRMTAAPFFDLNAKQFSAEDFSGQVLIVIFWAPWSVESAALLKELQVTWERLKQKGASDITFLPISYVDAAAVKSFCDEYGVTLTMYLDQDKRLFDHFDVQSMPLTLIVGRDGSVLYRIVGSAKWDSASVLNRLLSMATQKTEADMTEQSSAETHSLAAGATSAPPQEESNRGQEHGTAQLSKPQKRPAGGG